MGINTLKELEEKLALLRETVARRKRSEADRDKRVAELQKLYIELIAAEDSQITALVSEIQTAMNQHRKTWITQGKSLNVCGCVLKYRICPPEFNIPDDVLNRLKLAGMSNLIEVKEKAKVAEIKKLGPDELSLIGVTTTKPEEWFYVELKNEKETIKGEK